MITTIIAWITVAVTIAGLYFIGRALWKDIMSQEEGKPRRKRLYIYGGLLALFIVMLVVFSTYRLPIMNTVRSWYGLPPVHDIVIEPIYYPIEE